MRALLLIAVLGCCAESCGSERIGNGGSGPPVDGGIRCPLVGCEDQFTATVTVDATMVAAGTHTVEVVADASDMSCTIQFPPPAGDPILAQCTTGVAMYVEPADGKLTETIVVYGRPSSVHIQQLVGGKVILDQTVSPNYQPNEPNGPECGVACYQATATWTIP